MNETSEPVWDLVAIMDGLRSEDESRRHLNNPLDEDRRLDEAWRSAVAVEEQLVEAPGLIEHAEFLRGADARAASVDSLEEELVALAAVAQRAQELYFRQRRLELAVRAAADGGASKTAIAAAAEINRTSVYPWVNKARAFERKMRAHTRMDIYPDLLISTHLACTLCDARFELAKSFKLRKEYTPDDNDLVHFGDACLAMHRHWTTSHDWDPLKLDEPERQEPDQPDSDDTTGQAQHPQTPEEAWAASDHETIMELVGEGLLKFPQTLEQHLIDHDRKQATAASRAVRELIEKQGLASSVAEELEGFAERTDKEFGVLKAHIDRNRNESQLLAPVVALSRQVDHRTWALELAILHANDLGIKPATIARAADKAAATVKRWADNARTLIDQMRTNTCLKTGPTDETESLACGICDTEFEVDATSGSAYTDMYRHWKTHHTAARNETA